MPLETGHAQDAPSPAAAKDKPLPTVRLGRHDVLVLRGAIGNAGPLTMTYSFDAAGTTTQPTDANQATFILRSSVVTDPPVRCTITYSDQGQAAQLILSADSDLPELSLLGHTPMPLHPVRVQAPETDRLMQSALGPVDCTACDALYEPNEDWAIEFKGKLSCQPAVDGVVMLASTVAPAGLSQTVLTLRLKSDLLKTTFGFEPDRRARLALATRTPAGWTSCEFSSPLERGVITANVDTLLANLLPYGANAVRTEAEAGDWAERLPDTSMALESCPAPSATATPSVFAASSARQAWLRARAFAHDLLADYWGHNIIRRVDPGPIHVGDPLTLDQARLWATLAGLSGHTLMVADRLDTLPANRLEILRKIFPPAPIRGMDLFPHTRPRMWNLKVATRWGRWDLLALFNPTGQAQATKVWFDRLGLKLAGDRLFAVYDIWESRLIAVDAQNVSVHVPPTGCRLMAIREVASDRPTLLGSSRHVTDGAVDLHDVAYNERDLVLSGKCDVVGGIPTEIRIFVPENKESFAVADVRASADTLVRQAGPLLLIALQADESDTVNWVVSFDRAEQQFAPPDPPTRLETRQNTRGVALTWNGLDDRAVVYRLYRNGEIIGETPTPAFQDSTVIYNVTCTYKVTALDWAGRESIPSAEAAHRTPVPASVNLTQLVPLDWTQEAAEPGFDHTVQGNPLRVAGRRFRRGLGLIAPARISYFLGKGFETFTGEVGIDRETEGQGSATFTIRGDGRELFTSKNIRAGEPSQSFAVAVGDIVQLELLVEGDGEGIHATWGNPYLRAATFDTVLPEPTPGEQESADEPAP